MTQRIARGNALVLMWAVLRVAVRVSKVAWFLKGLVEQQGGRVGRLVRVRGCRLSHQARRGMCRRCLVSRGSRRIWVLGRDCGGEIHGSWRHWLGS